MISFIFLMALTFNAKAESSLLGGCYHDPKANELQVMWKHYHDTIKKKAIINSSFIVDEILMDSTTMKFIVSISESEELMKILDELERKFLRKAFVDFRFNEMIASDDFLTKLETGQALNEIKSSSLPFKENPDFVILMERAQKEIQRKEVKDALDLFKTYDLGLLQSEYRKSAKYALELIRGRGATPEVVRSWINDPPFLKNVPLPSTRIGPFAHVYRDLIQKSVANFVLDRKVKLEDAKKFYPSMDEKDLNEMNSLAPPVEKNSFDEYVAKFTDQQTSAIDGVLRTLWGEASSCEMQGLEQFYAIGKIIADRSLAIKKSIEELNSLDEKNALVREKNWDTFLKNWDGIYRPSPGMKNKVAMKNRGLLDYGRKDKVEIPPPAQVISKPNQFSVWNSYYTKKYHVGQFHQNIPDAIYEIKGPQSSNDDKALVRILCPKMESEKEKELWKKAENIATEIVTDTEAFSQKLKWNKKGDILFYTHDAKLPFAKEVKIDNLQLEGIKLKIKDKKKKGPCNKFRLFVPKI